MITLVEALNYRCLRYIRQPLGPFHVLVGPNASGKTTFLDVIAFLGRLVSDGPDVAIEERSQNFYDLIWRREGTQLELAIEARIPIELRGRLLRQESEIIRYEVVVGLDADSQDRGILAERVLLKQGSSTERSLSRPFPAFAEVPGTLLEPLNASQTHTSLIKSAGGLGSFYTETPVNGLNTWKSAATKTLRRSTFRSLDLDEDLFPATTWLRELLSLGIQQLVLNSLLIRRPSPPGQGPNFQPDGSNLPWVVADLRQRSPERFRQWIAHLQTAFPDLKDIKTVERPEDRHRYLILQYSEGLEVPSWMASDGTLRMLALTLPAYLEDKNTEASLKGLLSRFQALGFRRVLFDLYVHPDRDPGCLLRAHDFLRPFISRYERALVLLDRSGCGREATERTVLKLRGRLREWFPSLV